MLGGICSVRAINDQSVKVPQQSLFSLHKIQLSILVLWMKWIMYLFPTRTKIKKLQIFQVQHIIVDRAANVYRYILWQFMDKLVAKFIRKSCIWEKIYRCFLLLCIVIYYLVWVRTFYSNIFQNAVPLHYYYSRASLVSYPYKC